MFQVLKGSGKVNLHVPAENLCHTLDDWQGALYPPGMTPVIVEKRQLFPHFCFCLFQQLSVSYLGLLEPSFGAKLLRFLGAATLGAILGAATFGADLLALSTQQPCNHPHSVNGDSQLPKIYISGVFIKQGGTGLSGIKIEAESTLQLLRLCTKESAQY